MFTSRTPTKNRGSSLSRPAKVFVVTALVLVSLLAIFWFRGRARHLGVSGIVPWASEPLVLSDAGTGSLDEVPDTPSREDVGRALGEVRPLVAFCGAGESGVVRVHLTIAGKTGTVTDARVIKQFADTDIARCAMDIVKGVQFPRFLKREFTVVYPFRIGRVTDGDGAAGTDGM